MVGPLAPGVHLVHKPAGPSSHARMREFSAENGPNLCHGGTLDPFATGLLLLLAGDATRLFPYLHAIPKVYEVEVAWGTETTNGDPTGAPTLEAPPPERVAPLERAAAAAAGWSEQVPHPTSARRVDGERAYERVMRGEEVTMAPARIYIHSASWLSHDLPQRSRLRVVCRGGVYVRALVRDLGRAVGSAAHVASLHRSAIGPWGDPGPARVVRVQGDGLMGWCPTLRLKQSAFESLRAGLELESAELDPPRWPLPPGFPDPDAPIRGMMDGRLMALMRPVSGRLRAERVFKKGL